MITRIQAQQHSVYSNLASAQKPVGQSAVLNQAKFGHLATELSPTTKAIYKYIAPIWRNRGIELLVVDLVAWAGIRTTLDLYREFIFKKTNDGNRKFNWPAARERLLMEVMGTAPDAIGLLALWAGLAMKNPFSAKFTDMDTLNYLKKTIKSPVVKNSQDLIQQLAKDLAPKQSQALLPLLQKGLAQSGSVDDTAVQIAKLLKQPYTDRAIQGTTFATETLLSDAQAFLKHVPAKNGAWKVGAQKLIQDTIRVDRIRIPVLLAIGAAFNFTAPYFIQGITRKFEGINDYPGEMGLRDMKHVDKFHDAKRGMLPYLRESLRKGNYLPVLTSLVPLPFVFGLFDAERLATDGFKAAFNNPLKKGFINRSLNMMRYSRSFPYAGTQQIVMLQALVLFSRVASARNAVEFRERTIDAFLGSYIWLFLTPQLKKVAAKWFDKHQGTQMMKLVAGEASKKSEFEITKLIPNKRVLAKTLTKYAHINIGAILSTIVLLGLVEPYLSIRLTEWQSKRLSPKPDAITVE